MRLDKSLINGWSRVSHKVEQNINFLTEMLTILRTRSASKVIIEIVLTVEIYCPKMARLCAYRAQCVRRIFFLVTDDLRKKLKLKGFF